MAVRKIEEKVTKNGLTGEEKLSHEIHISVWKYVLSVFETIKIITNREANNSNFCPPTKITARVSM